jgi:hypothetical protein
MTAVIEFPPHVKCPVCDVRLRPATVDEIRADLLDTRFRQIAAMAAQGNRDFDPNVAYPDWIAPDTVELHPTWLLRCDRCGHRMLWGRQDER